MNLENNVWADLIAGFFNSKNIKLGNYKYGIFNDENYHDQYKHVKKVAVFTLEEPIVSSNQEFDGAKRIKIHFDEFHFWSVTTHKFRSFKVHDEEWINYLRANHPEANKYNLAVNEFLFNRDKSEYERQLVILNNRLARCKEDAKKYEEEIERLQSYIFDLAKKYNVTEKYKTR